MIQLFQEMQKYVNMLFGHFRKPKSQIFNNLKYVLAILTFSNASCACCSGNLITDEDVHDSSKFVQDKVFSCPSGQSWSSNS